MYSLGVCTFGVECSDKVELNGCIVDCHSKIAVDLEGSIAKNICYDVDGLLYDHYGSNSSSRITPIECRAGTYNVIEH